MNLEVLMPRLIPSVLIAIATILFLGPVFPAAAAPTIDLSWDSCSPIVVAKVPVPGQPVATLYCSVTGMDRVHKGYVSKLWFATEMKCRTETSTPDAWRFDPPGCQSGLAQVDFGNTDPACPPMSGPTGPVLTISTFEYSPVDFNDQTAVGSMRGTLAAAYPNTPQTPDPARRYHLFAIRFDHTFSVEGEGTPGVTCGGNERPLCLALWSGLETHSGNCSFHRRLESVYVDAEAGVEIPFQLGQAFASFGLEQGTAFSCFEVVPARATTWGAIKARHR